MRDVLRSEFWLLLVGAVCAGFGVTGWIVVPAVMAGLLISSLPKYGPLYRQAQEVGAEVPFWITVLSSVIIALVAALAAFIAGRFTWWLWGRVRSSYFLDGLAFWTKAVRSSRRCSQTMAMWRCADSRLSGLKTPRSTSTGTT